MSKTKILFAEDDIEDQMIIKDAFDELGFLENITFVENGEDVLAYLGQLEPSLLPRLIVLDLNMPRMNGTETLRALKQIGTYKDIKVIIFSTSVNKLEKSTCMALGALSYITKPVKYHESIIIARHLSEYFE